MAMIQCMKCGNLHIYQSDVIRIHADSCTDHWCGKCRKATPHIIIGSQRDQYLYGDPVLDPRYYSYKKKKEN